MSSYAPFSQVLTQFPLQLSAIRSVGENKEILLFSLEKKSESSNFLLIFGIGKFRSVYAFGWKKFQAYL